MEIIYRKATEKDAKEWYQFSNKVWRDAYKNIFPKEVFDYQDRVIEENSQKFIKKLNNETKILYVAEYNKKIVGIMWGEINSTYEYFGNDYADLVALYIDPEFQNKGIGNKLRNIFEDWAKEQGATKYVIGVLKDNIKARKVYEKWGGTLSSHEQDFVKLNVGYREVFYTYNL